MVVYKCKNKDNYGFSVSLYILSDFSLFQC